MARRRRLSIVTAQLGSGISRSPLSFDLVDGSRSSSTPTRSIYPVDVLPDQLHSCDNANYGNSSGEAWVRS